VTVGRDGTWTRRAAYIVSDIDLGAGADKSKKDSVSEAFALPSGEGWKLTRQQTKDEKRVIAERTLPLGQSIENDIMVKEAPKVTPPPMPDADGKPGVKTTRLDDPPQTPKTLSSNTATVRQVSPGRLAYTETIHWTGEMPTNMHKLDEKETALVRAALPPALATDENVTFIAESFSREFYLALIGPPSPLMHRLPMLMSAPEVFGRLVSRRIGGALLASLEKKFGDRLTVAQRRRIAAQLIERMTDEIRASGPSQASDAHGADANQNSSGASIFLSVKLPGRVVETNGIADAFNGDISWSFYPEAAAFGDITLTATCDSTAKQAVR
jgi:hypothetical protein